MYSRPVGYFPTERPTYARFSTSTSAGYNNNTPGTSHGQDHTHAAPVYPPPAVQMTPQGRFAVPAYAPPSYRETKLARQQRFRQDLDEQVRLKTERKLREKKELEAGLALERQGTNQLSGREAAKHIPVPAPIGRIEHLSFPIETGIDNNLGVSRPVHQFDSQLQQGEPLSGHVQARHNMPPSVPAMDKLPLLYDTRQAPNEFTTPRGTTYSRFQVDRAPPEVRNERQDRHRKQQEVERMLRLQLEEKHKRKADEKRRLAEEEEKERRRLEREREELRIAYEREKKGINNREGNTSQAPVEWSTNKDQGHMEEEEADESQPLLPDKVFNDSVTHPVVDSRELQAFREEVIAQHDSLKQQVDSQERLLAHLQREVEAVKYDREAKHAKEQSRRELELVLTSKSKFVRPSEESPGAILQRGGLLSPTSLQRSHASYTTRSPELTRPNTKGDSASWDEDNTDQLDQLLKDFVSKGK